MMQPDTFRTITDPSKGTYKEKGSRFIAHAFPVNAEEEVRNHLADLRKEYHDARHHAYAFCLGPDRRIYRVNDDGEPSGTAGKPVYGQLLSNDLTDLLVVVVRYFGGTKLGVPGLINAYRTAAGEALKAAQIVTKTVDESVTVTFPYSALNGVMRIIREESASIRNKDLSNTCTVSMNIRRSGKERLTGRLSAVPGLRLESGRI